ncbi:EAL and HDOD domain-containing protein [Collimonas sp. OK242]|jgi:EAL and modified HD-GYP domain-containing signal transduction protein|uniref:EAL and HDOD domain-containing protein n=1 Tax=Collimonas sp. OK242 TaxID=1798195 RepID=UPI000B88004D|nr:HDOD domain-containing protein [Collimonas sp. OK242]
MRNENFIVREPLLDPKQVVIGYDLTWQETDDDADVQTKEYDLLVLLSFVADKLSDEKTGWLLGNKLLFLEASPALLKSEALKRMPAASIVLTLKHSDLADPDTLAAVNTLRAEGYGISLRDAELAGAALPADISHLEVRFSAGNFAAQARHYAALKKSSLRMVGRPVSNWQDYDACALLGLDAFIGKLHLTPRPGKRATGLNPAQKHIVQIMNLVAKNENLQKIEEIFKHDPGLSYELLRFINSAAFGLKTEVQSLRAALALLGYEALFQWLSLLLATASSSGYSPVLMETAIVRGRFSELLGKKYLPKGESENLFVAGIFSLLDRLLGVSMEEVLANIKLSDQVAAALLTRSGPYGPYVALAEACELNSPLIGPLASSLKISPAEVNLAHLSALAWAQNLGVKAV